MVRAYPEPSHQRVSHSGRSITVAMTVCLPPTIAIFDAIEVNTPPASREEGLGEEQLLVS